MTELLFWETTMRRTPVSLAVELVFGFAVGFGFGEETNYADGWYDLTIYLGPLNLVFTIYGRST